jgi:hypothetical protein
MLRSARRGVSAGFHVYGRAVFSRPFTHHEAPLALFLSKEDTVPGHLRAS